LVWLIFCSSWSWLIFFFAGLSKIASKLVGVANLWSGTLSQFSVLEELGWLILLPPSLADLEF
jgi:hypothetical protein